MAGETVPAGAEYPREARNWSIRLASELGRQTGGRLDDWCFRQLRPPVDGPEPAPS